MMTKIEQRAQARARRENLAAQLPDFAYRIAQFADAIPIPLSATVASYRPILCEADPGALADRLATRGHALLLPRVQYDRLVFHHWQKGDALELRGRVEEPYEAAPVGTPDVLFVPLLAFDADGFRLGYGGGHYDRALAALRANGHALAVGIAYAGQEMDRLPHEAHDEPLDMVITEREIRRFSRN